MENEIENKKEELYQLKLKIKKMKSANNSNSSYYKYLLNEIEREKEKITKYLNYEIPREKDKLKRREDYLEKIKNQIHNKILFNNFRKSKLKLKINCIYYDTTIDASDETTSSYEFSNI